MTTTTTAAAAAAAAATTTMTTAAEQTQDTKKTGSATDEQQQQQQQRSQSLPKNESHKKRRTGRAARRRRAKQRAIQQAVEQIWNASTTSTAAAAAVPTDRDKVWPGVLERRSTGWTHADEAALLGQLGYIPGNAVAVAARSSDYPLFPINGNVPIVLKLYPLAIREAFAGGKSGRKFKSRKRGPGGKAVSNKSSSSDKDNTTDGPDGVNDADTGAATTADNNDKVDEDDDDDDEMPLLEPFPTMYWLTHPLIRTLVSQIELGKDFNATEMERRLAKSEEARTSMEEAHKAYGETRWNLLTESDVALIKKRHWEGALSSERGVAGIRQPRGVKCLHAHMAHYLSGDDGHEHNVVGKWTYEQVNRIIREHQELETRQQTTDSHEDRSSTEGEKATECEGIKE